MNFSETVDAILEVGNTVFGVNGGIITSERNNGVSFVIRPIGLTFEKSMLAGGCATAFQNKLSCVYTFPVDNTLRSFKEHIEKVIFFMFGALAVPNVTSVQMVEVDFDDTDEIGYAVVEVTANGMLE